MPFGVCRDTNCVGVDCDNLGKGGFNVDEVVKSRHPGENRGPVLCPLMIFLDTGFCRYDDFVEFSTFYEAIKVAALMKSRKSTLVGLLSGAKNLFFTIVYKTLHPAVAV